MPRICGRLNSMQILMSKSPTHSATRCGYFARKATTPNRLRGFTRTDWSELSLIHPSRRRGIGSLAWPLTPWRTSSNCPFARIRNGCRIAEEGLNMEPVTVLTFNEPEHAEPLKQRLEQAGIPAAIYDERRL